MDLFSLETPGFSHGSPRPTRGTLRIAEVFTSRQGEGKLTGVESFFIRVSGCNLRCWFCDTPYASWEPEGQPIALSTLVDQALASGCSHVVLTGGEPLLPKQSPQLCDLLRAQGFHVTLETAGTVDRDIACDLLSLSPKLASSTPQRGNAPHGRSLDRWSKLHEERRMPIDVMSRLIKQAVETQVKFVVSSPADFAEILDVVSRLGVQSRDVWLMPQGITEAEIDANRNWLEPWCHQLAFTYCDRMHIRWYGNRRGT